MPLLCEGSEDPSRGRLDLGLELLILQGQRRLAGEEVLQVLRDGGRVRVRLMTRQGEFRTYIRLKPVSAEARALHFTAYRTQSTLGMTNPSLTSSSCTRQGILPPYPSISHSGLSSGERGTSR